MELLTSSQLEHHSATAARFAAPASASTATPAAPVATAACFVAPPQALRGDLLTGPPQVLQVSQQFPVN